MKRIVVLLTVVALMVGMLAMSVAPAFAAWNAVGCRGTDTLFPAQAPALQSIDGKFTEDDQVCLAHRGHEGTKIGFYDNRPA